MTDYPVYHIELRATGSGGIEGYFPYKAVATISDRGKVRKERIGRGAFDWSIDRALDIAIKHDIHALHGHSYGRPLGSLKSGTATLKGDSKGLTLAVKKLPDTSYVRDMLAVLAAGVPLGISPGFHIPPPDVVEDAVTYEPEEGNADVEIRVINQAVLHEMSIVTRPAYPETEVIQRSRSRRRRRPYILL